MALKVAKCYGYNILKGKWQLYKHSITHKLTSLTHNMLVERNALDLAIAS